jgi:hypothetical protein
MGTLTKVVAVGAVAVLAGLGIGLLLTGDVTAGSSTHQGPSHAAGMMAEGTGGLHGSTPAGMDEMHVSMPPESMEAMHASMPAGTARMHAQMPRAMQQVCDEMHADGATDDVEASFAPGGGHAMHH